MPDASFGPFRRFVTTSAGCTTPTRPPSASICPSTTTNDARSPTTTCRPPHNSHLTPPPPSGHLTPPAPRATSPAPLSATWPVKQKKCTPATLFFFQVCSPSPLPVSSPPN